VVGRGGGLIGGRSPRYEVLDHTADTGILAYGVTLEQLFEHAAYGMFDLMFDLEAVTPSREVAAGARADTRDELLVAWLGELLSLSEIDDLAFSVFTVGRLGEGGVEGFAGGAPAAGMQLRGPPIKAVTYHDLEVAEVAGGWRARVLFDV
jgi:SHS2 domain-containing protein